MAKHKKRSPLNSHKQLNPVAQSWLREQAAAQASAVQAESNAEIPQEEDVVEEDRNLENPDIVDEIPEAKGETEEKEEKELQEKIPENNRASYHSEEQRDSSVSAASSQSEDDVALDDWEIVSQQEVSQETAQKIKENYEAVRKNDLAMATYAAAVMEKDVLYPDVHDPNRIADNRMLRYFENFYNQRSNFDQTEKRIIFSNRTRKEGVREIQTSATRKVGFKNDELYYEVKNPWMNREKRQERLLQQMSGEENHLSDYIPYRQRNITNRERFADLNALWKASWNEYSKDGNYEVYETELKFAEQIYDKMQSLSVSSMKALTGGKEYKEARQMQQTALKDMKEKIKLLKDYIKQDDYVSLHEYQEAKTKKAGKAKEEKPVENKQEPLLQNEEVRSVEKKKIGLDGLKKASGVEDRKSVSSERSRAGSISNERSLSQSLGSGRGKR